MLDKFTIFLLTLLCLTRLKECARILGVFPMAAPSHYIVNSALMRGLAEAGHDVTLISPFTEKDPPKNGSWREIVLDGFIEDHNKQLAEFNVFEHEINPFLSFLFLNAKGNEITEKTLQNPKVQKLLRSNEKFDAVIVGQFLCDGLNVFASHFDSHLILLSPMGANLWNNQLVGNPSLPSIYPELAFNYPLKMSLWQRIKNTVYRICNYINLNFFLYPKQNHLVQKYLQESFDINKVLYNVSLILLNSHVSVSKPHAHVPNMIEIGGFHVKPPKKLPEDLKKFLDDAKEGVIYFSMGSNLKSKYLPVHMRNEILKAFGKRKEKVLWKWEDDVLPEQPPNVHLKKWLPQQDVLAHPNVKVFITHGGLLSTIETVYHGVPIIGIPVFGDQGANVNQAEQLGYGLVLPLRDISEERLTELLDEIISNPKYRENVRARSEIMQDRQIKPLDQAVYWVEYIIRHNGAKHLRVGYMDLYWFQYYLLDVFAILFGSSFLIVVIIKRCLISLCKKQQRKTKQKRS